MKTILLRPNQALIFATVADCGSFTQAAEILDCSKAHASAQVIALEKALGVQLMLRTTRRLTLTDAGNHYLEYAQQLREVLTNAERIVGATRLEVSGRLRVTAPNSFAERVIPALTQAFQKVHPEIEFDVDFTLRPRDLLADAIDVGFRSVQQQDGYLVARPAGVLQQVVVASTDVVTRYGLLEHPGELADLPCVVNSHLLDSHQWRFTKGAQSFEAGITTRSRFGGYTAVRGAAMLGMGAARLPLYLVDEDLKAGALHRLCPDWTMPGFTLDIVYPGHRHVPLRTRTFVAFALEWLALQNQSKWFA
ncbi:MAG: LysR substrate-binding domain-containing protein [Pseudomonas sp.]